MATFISGKPEVSNYRYYSEIFDELKTGDLLCWRVNTFNNFFTFILFIYHKLFKATFSHIGVVLRLGDQVFAVEAVHPKVRLIPLHMLKSFYVYRLNLPDRKSFVRLLLRHIGKDYSLFDMVKRMFSIRTDTDELYCAELAFDFYDSIGFFEVSFDEFDGAISTPDDLVKLVIEKANVLAEFVKIDKGNIDYAS